MKQTILVTMLLVLAMAAGVSAQIDIRAEDGTDLSAVTYCGDTFTVQIVEDGTPVGSGTNVAFVLASISGDPIYVTTDLCGKAKYKPRVNGILIIRVLNGVDIVAEAIVTVEDEPWVPVPEPTPERNTGGGGGGFVLPDPAPANTTNNTTQIDSEVEPELEPEPEPEPELTKKLPTRPGSVTTVTDGDKDDNKLPGFGGVFAVLGLLSIVYIMRRRD
jgi:PGF-CTERM protein